MRCSCMQVRRKDLPKPVNVGGSFMMNDELERQRLLRELTNALRTFTDKTEVRPLDGYYDTPAHGLVILRSDRTLKPIHRISKSALWISVQGLKSAFVGEQRFDYGAGEGLLTTVDIPCRCTIPKATAQEPFLGLVVELSRTAFQEIGEALNSKQDQIASEPVRGAISITLNSQMLDCILRSVRLLDMPAAISVLYPSILREMSYWLLSGMYGPQAMNIAMARGQDQRTIQAIRQLRTDFPNNIRVEDRAKAAGMSLATFHRQFRSVTSLSPVQYQKQLRLLEARRMIMTNHPTVGETAYQVGYSSASQFSREYTRMFGKSPRADLAM